MDNIYSSLFAQPDTQYGQQDQIGQQPTISYSGLFEPPSVLPTGNPSDRMKLAEEYLKMRGEEAKLNKAEDGGAKQFNVFNQPDIGLVEQQMGDLQNFLKNLMTNLHASGTGTTITMDPAMIKGAVKAIQDRQKALETELSQIRPPGGAIPKEQADVYNQLQLESKMLGDFNNVLSKVSPQNPTIPVDDINSVINEMNIYSGGVKSGQKNPYAQGDPYLQQILGQGSNPTIKTLEDMTGRSAAIDKFIRPYIDRALGSTIQGGSINDVNKRLTLSQGSKVPLEDAAAEAMVNFVHQTYTLPKEQRESLWNMFPIWAASQGLNWGNIKTRGVQIAEEKARKWAEPNKKVPQQSTGFMGPNEPKETKQISNTQPSVQQSRIGKVGSRISDIGTTGARGIMDVLGTMATPFEATSEYFTSPENPSFMEAVRNVAPTDVQSLAKNTLNFLAPEPTTQDWAAAAKNIRKQSPNIETRLSAYEGEPVPPLPSGLEENQ